MLIATKAAIVAVNIRSYFAVVKGDATGCRQVQRRQGQCWDQQLCRAQRHGVAMVRGQHDTDEHDRNERTSEQNHVGEPRKGELMGGSGIRVWMVKHKNAMRAMHCHALVSQR